MFQRNAIDGHMLLRMDDRFASESLHIASSLKRRKLLIQVEALRRKQMKAVKVREESVCAVVVVTLLLIGSPLSVPPTFLPCLLSSALFRNLCQGKTLDQLDEYVMVLENHRIKVLLLRSVLCSIHNTLT